MNVVFDDHKNDGAGAQPKSSDEPLDLSAVVRDEQLINALLGGGEVQTASDDEFEIASLFSAARHEVLDAPIGFELTDEQITAAMAQGAPAGHTRTRLLITRLAAGAASVAVVLGGLTIVANQMGSSPGPTEGQTQQIVSASMIRADLDEAADLINSGDVSRGVELINATTSKMGQLDRTAEFEELDKIRVHLWSRATGQPEAAAPVAGSQPTAPNVLPASTPPQAPPVNPGGAQQLPMLPLLDPPTSESPAPEVTEEPTVPATSVPPTTTTPPPPTSTTPPPTSTTKTTTKSPVTPASTTGAPAGPGGQPAGD